MQIKFEITDFSSFIINFIKSGRNNNDRAIDCKLNCISKASVCRKEDKSMHFMWGLVKRRIKVNAIYDKSRLVLKLMTFLLSLTIIFEIYFRYMSHHHSEGQRCREGHVFL